MATQIPTPIIHVFKEINEGKYATVKHYELQEVRGGNTLLTNYLNISKNRNFANSMPEYWVKIKEGKKWGKWITGLFKTRQRTILKGDINRKRHLVLFEFSNDARVLTVYYFQNFYVQDTTELLKHFTKVQA